MISFRLISYLFSAGVLTMLGYLVYQNNRSGLPNRTFAAMTVSIVSWIVCLAFADTTNSLMIADIASRGALVAGGCLMLSVLYVSLAFSGRSFKRAWIWAIPILLTSLSAPTSLGIEKVTLESYGAGVVGGLMYYVFSLVAVVYLILAVIYLAKAAKRAQGQVRAQLTIMSIGLAASTFIALVTNLLFVDLANVGPASFIIFASFTAYAMVRHHLLDIRLVVARSVAYLLVITLLTIMYAAGLFAIVRIFFPESALTVEEVSTFIALAVVISFTVSPIQYFFQRSTVKLFYRDHYDAQGLLGRISEILASQLELKPLMEKFLRELTGTMHISNAQLIVVDEGEIYGRASRGPLKNNQLNTTGLALFIHPLMVADTMPTSDTLRQSMDELRIRVAMQLRAHGELVGYLILGDKLSGEAYSNQDLAVLEIMRKELAVAVANAKAYDEIAAFNVTLQERIRDATKRLKVANKNLRTLDKTKDDFISMASHQLGTPLTAITGYLSMALDNDNKNMTPDQREFVGYALEAAEKMVYMSGDMLNVSRLNSGRFMIQRQTIDLAKAIQQEIHQLMPSAERKGLKLTTDLPTQPVLASVDESKTRQVIMNFIDNALYYTQAGGVHVKLDVQSGHVRFTVTDTGIGVPPEEQSKLFAKFFRAGNAKDIRPDGTGLGLYLAKRVIEDQGGTIIFASEMGKGSTFGFDLPTQA